MERQFKQWWSTNPPISIFHIHTLSTKDNVGNPGPGLRQVQVCGGVKPVKVLQPSLLITGSPMAMTIQQQC